MYPRMGEAIIRKTPGLAPVDGGSHQLEGFQCILVHKQVVSTHDIKIYM